MKIAILILLTAGVCIGSPVEPKTKVTDGTKTEVKKVERDLTKLLDSKIANQSLPVDGAPAAANKQLRDVSKLEKLPTNASKPLSRRETLPLKKNETKKIGTRAAEDLKKSNVSKVADGSRARRDVPSLAKELKPEEIAKLKGAVTKRDTMGMPPKGMPPMGMKQMQRVVREAVEKSNDSSISPKFLTVKPKRDAEKLGTLLNATKDEKKVSHPITKRDTVPMQNEGMMPVRAMMMKREAEKPISASKNGSSKVVPRAAPAPKLPLNATKTKQVRSAEKPASKAPAKDEKKASQPMPK